MVIRCTIALVLIFGCSAWAVETQFHIGIDGNQVLLGNWLPVTVQLTAPTAMRGQLEMTVQTASGDTVFTVRQPVHLGESSYRSVLPIASATEQLIIALETGEDTLFRQTFSLKRSPATDERVLAVSDRPGPFLFLTMPGVRQVLETSLQRLPDDWQGYTGIDTVVISGRLSVLEQNQVAALWQWAQLGGTLIITGAHLERNLDHYLLQPFQASLVGPRRLPGPELPIWQIATPANVLLQTEGIPLVAGEVVGAGAVFLVPLDWEQEQVQRWPERRTVLEQLLLTHPLGSLPGGIFDHLAEDLIRLIPYQLPASLPFLMFAIAFGSLVFFLGLHVQNNLRRLLPLICLLLLIASAGMHLLFGRSLQVENQVQLQIALLDAYPGSGHASVEAYFALTAVHPPETVAVFQRSGGLFGRSWPAALQVNVMPDTVQVSISEPAAGFRANYATQLPLLFRVERGHEGYEIEVVNQSDLTIEAMYLWEHGRWHEIEKQMVLYDAPGGPGPWRRPGWTSLEASLFFEFAASRIAQYEELDIPLVFAILAGPPLPEAPRLALYQEHFFAYIAVPVWP